MTGAGSSASYKVQSSFLYLSKPFFSASRSASAIPLFARRVHELFPAPEIILALYIKPGFDRALFIRLHDCFYLMEDMKQIVLRKFCHDASLIMGKKYKSWQCYRRIGCNFSRGKVFALNAER